MMKNIRRLLPATVLAATCFGLQAAIQTGAGTTSETEIDWQDGSAHPLTLTRRYRSSVTPDAGLGLWTHPWAAWVQRQPTELAIYLPDGNSSLFYKAAGGAWVALNARDLLQDNAEGQLFVRASDESKWQFAADGRLLHVTQRNGWRAALSYNAQGVLERVTNAFGRSIVFARDSAGRVAAADLPDGSRIVYAHDGVKLSAVSYPDGTSRSYSYQDKNLTAVYSGATAVRSYAYDGFGRAISMNEPGGAGTVTVAYPATTSSGTLSAVTTTDPSEYQATLQVSNALGQPVQQTWIGGNGEVRLAGASSAAGGGIASTAPGPMNLPVATSDFLGVQTQYAWDTARQLQTGKTEAAGRAEQRTTQTEWHPSLRLPVRVTEPGRVTETTYDALGNKLTETITDTATGEKRTWAWTYTAQGLPATMKDPKGGTWTYSHDAAGNRTSETDPLGRVTRTTHDGAGRVVSRTDASGLVTTYAFDTRGRIVSQAVGEEVTRYAYAANGQLASATMPNGYQVAYVYDAALRLIGATDNRAASVAFTLDAMGNRVREEVKDASGAIALATSRVINNLNKVAAIQGGAGQTTSIAYDANGEPIAETDPLNQTTRQTLDGLRRTTATTFADNAVASQAWTALDDLAKVTDPKGVTTQYTANAFGEVMTETSPDIGTIKYTRDANGEITRIEDAKGQITKIERDALGRPVRVEYAADQVVGYSYDNAGTVTSIDDKSGSTRYVRDNRGRILAKTQTVNDNPSSPSSFEVKYGYTAGDLTSVRYPSGLLVTYRRTAGRIAGIDVQAPGKAALTFVSSVTHTALGQPRAWAWSNGATASRSFDADGRMTANELAQYSYDAAGRITGITQKLWASRTVTTVTGTTTMTTTELFQKPISWTAGYDARNRLTNFSREGAATQYAYDPNSNRLTAAETSGGEVDLEGAFDQPSQAQSLAQALKIEPTSNRLLGFTQTLTKTQSGQAVASASSAVNYTLDANGAMTSDGLRTFEYDANHRLAKVLLSKDGEAAAIDYLHNAIGQRVFKSEPQVEQTLPKEEDLGPGFINWLKKNFGWMFLKGKKAKGQLGESFVYGDGEIPEWALLGSYDNGTATGKGTSEFIWLPTEDGMAIPVGLYRAGKFYAIHTDHLGTPRLMTDSTNRPVWQWPYSGFGNNKPTGVLATATANGVATAKASKPAAELNLRFPGQFADEETGTFYNFLRDSMDPASGRFRQFDPIRLAGGWNGYTYADNTPLMFTDPHGLQATIPGPGGMPIPIPSPTPGKGGGGGYDPYTDSWLPGRSLPTPDFLKPNQCPPENDCDKLNADVQRAKEKVGKFHPAACNAGMSKAELLERASAWLELAVARAKRDQKCWASGDAGHQQAQADAWSNLSRCQRLLR